MCAHWVGGASTYRFVCAMHNLFSLSYHQTLSKSHSERTQRRSSQRERMRAGYAEAVVCGSRTLELPQSVDMGAPRSPQGNGANGLQCDNFVALCGVSLWRSKTKNFLSISFSASRRRGGGRRREENARKFFGFCIRESASVSEARITPRQDSIQNTFELRSIHTAMIRENV